ncbi:MAG: hypothetical protein H0X29_00765 [Parachlamydiaceae bacterium]|nr:hypothetical protein [Parachlamydiaceae bacterium]
MSFCISNFFCCVASDDALQDHNDPQADLQVEADRLALMIKSNLSISQNALNEFNPLSAATIKVNNGGLECCNGTIPQIITSAKKVCLVCNFKVEDAIKFIDKEGKSFRGNISVNDGCAIGNLEETKKSADVSFITDEYE